MAARPAPRKTSDDIGKAVLAATADLRDRASALRFGEPVACVYNPLQHAWELHRQYVLRYGSTPRRVLMLGMNPGPWGMVQTGVPFGEVAAVRDWLKLKGEVQRPAAEHPKRPIQGLDCPRSEVSGRRLWGYFAEVFGTPEAFFAEHFVVNFCPLAFLEAGGRNLTPDKLPRAETDELFAGCEQRLARLVDLYRPEWVVGVGAFARSRLEGLFGAAGQGPKVGGLLHPSPASPAANRGWAEAAGRQLRSQGIWTRPI